MKTIRIVCDDDTGEHSFVCFASAVKEIIRQFSQLGLVAAMFVEDTEEESDDPHNEQDV